MADRKSTARSGEPVAAQFELQMPSGGRSHFASEALAAEQRVRDARLSRACEIANEDLDVAELESELDAITDEITETWE